MTHGSPTIETTSTRSVLHVADSAGDAARLRRALEAVGVPFDTGLLAEPPPRVVFFVADVDLEIARAVVAESLGRGAPPSAPAVGGIDFAVDVAVDDDYDDDDDDDAPARFPLAEIAPLASLVAGHLAVVLWSRGPFPLASQVIEQGALAAGGTALQPWRLLTSLVIHLGPAHVLSNALGLFAFGVPLIAWCGLRAAAGVYVAAGVGGGLAALSIAEAGTRIAGSSGAVAGLFGAWVVLAWSRGRDDDLPGRARVRAAGVALLVLPSLLTPIGASGQPISVESHVGGLATGMALGAMLAGGLLARVGRPAIGPSPDVDRRFAPPPG